MKCLIVEDNKDMRRLIKSVVGPLAEAVYECSDGAEALAQYAAQRPDVVLMDIEMSGLDGICATQAIIAAFPAAHVIIVTNYDDQHHRTAAQAAGARDYLTKENLLELKQLLTALNGESATRQLLPPTPE